MYENCDVWSDNQRQRRALVLGFFFSVVFSSSACRRRCSSVCDERLHERHEVSELDLCGAWLRLAVLVGRGQAGRGHVDDRNQHRALAGSNRQRLVVATQLAVSEDHYLTVVQLRALAEPTTEKQKKKGERRKIAG